MGRVIRGGSTGKVPAKTSQPANTGQGTKSLKFGPDGNRVERSTRIAHRNSSFEHRSVTQVGKILRAKLTDPKHSLRSQEQSTNKTRLGIGAYLQASEPRAAGFADPPFASQDRAYAIQVGK